MPTLEEYTSYVFGEGLDQLDPEVLPKELDVLRFLVHSFDVSQAEVSRMDKVKRKAQVVNVVVSAVEKIWNGKGIPIRSHGAVYYLVKMLYERAEFVKLSKRRHVEDGDFIQDIINQHDKLFDISEKPKPVKKPEEPMDVDENVEEEEDLGKRKRKAPAWFGVGFYIQFRYPKLRYQNGFQY